MFKTKYNGFFLLIMLSFFMFMLIGSVSADNQIINTTSTGGLASAIENVGSGQIVYMENGVYSGKNNTNLTISKNLTISGKGSNVVIDGKGLNRIFYMDYDTTVKLVNLKLINGHIDGDYGGAIHSRGTLIVNGCTFSNNYAGFNGGAIYKSSGGDVFISGSTFTNNSADNDGGAIYSTDSILENSRFSISNSTFINNNAKLYGGAISRPYGDFSVSNCTFTNNHAGFNGGAIITMANFVVSGSTFTNNNVDHCGGAIHSSAKLSVNNCIFKNNKAESDGGAIRSTSSLSITNSVFNNNQVTFGYGGAILGVNMTIASSNFTNNLVKDSSGAFNAGGGAISVSHTGVARINSAIFKNNKAGTKNNAIHLMSRGNLKAKVYKDKVTITPDESPKANLKVTKVQKKGNYRYVTIKNIGDGTTSKKFYLGIYVGKKQIKKVLVKILGTGKSTIVKVPIAKKYANKLKTFKADSTNLIIESDKKNNSYKAR